MNYDVGWNGDALVQLTAAWLQSADRGAVTAAQTRIDRLLAADPYGNGTFVSEDMYAIEVHPLRVQSRFAMTSVSFRSSRCESGHDCQPNDRFRHSIA